MPEGSAEATPGSAHEAVGRLHDLRTRDNRRAAVAALARAAGAAVVLLVGYYVMPLAVIPQWQLVVRIAVGAGVVVGVIVWQLRAVNRAAMPLLRAVEALAVTVTVVVVVFAMAYVSMSRHDPSSFNEVLGRTSSLYFTLSTLATVGFGDIHAQTDGARTAVMVQIVANVVVLGAAVRLILGLARHRRGRSQPHGSLFGRSAPPDG